MLYPSNYMIKGIYNHNQKFYYYLIMVGSEIRGLEKLVPFFRFKMYMYFDILKDKMPTKKEFPVYCVSFEIVMESFNGSRELNIFFTIALNMLFLVYTYVYGLAVTYVYWREIT